MTIHFDLHIKKKQKTTHFDDTVKQSRNKNETFTVNNEYHTRLRKTGLKAAPDKTIFFLENFFLDHVISFKGLDPIAKRVKVLMNLKQAEKNGTSWKCKDALSYIAVSSRTSMCTVNFRDLLNDSTLFHWSLEHEKLIQSIKDRTSEDTILGLPSTDYLFPFHVESSDVGITCIPFEQILEGERIIYFNSRIFDKTDQ